MTEFCEIGARSNFSFLEGASRPEDMVLTAAALGLAGICIADRNSVAGVVRAHMQAKTLAAPPEKVPDKGGDGEIRLPPIPFQPGARLVFADDTPDILAFAEDRRGWANLCRLLSAGNLRTQKGQCLLYEADLLQFHENLMLAVLPPRRRPEGQEAELEDFLKRLKAACRDRVYLALSPAYDGFDRLVFADRASLARRLKLPLIATNEPLYHLPERRPLADVVTAIRNHVTLAEAGFLLQPNAERHVKHGAEMKRLLLEHDQAVDNTVKFFRRLKFSLDELGHLYPDESVQGETLTETLARLTWEGASARFPEGMPGKLVHQIQHELKLIREKHYEGYFLTIRSIMNFARSQSILCQGRGSAANSTVCYCLKITDVNPKKSTLLFERFISTERDEPPDIDVDFEHARRQEIIEHIYKTYGRDHAGLAAGVTTYRTRSACREVAKVFGLSEDVQAALAANVWGWWTHGLSPEQVRLSGLDAKDPTTRRVAEYTRQLMEFPRHLTQHVGGFVITRDRLDEIVPIMNTASEDRYMIEWDKDDLDNVRLFKIDILALGMLTCMAKAFTLLQLHYDVKKTLADLGNDTHEDEVPVYDMICRADTIGVFQIESRAQMSMLPRLRPRRFYDLVVEVAIVRPGPIQGNMVHPYLKRREMLRQGKEIDYRYPDLKVVLERTLGVPLFQEQAMQIAITAAGFKAGEADMLRRAMATFKRSGKLAYFKDKFIAGMVKKKYDREFAENCFSQIEGFGEYGFPESHAASFALLVYASSWVKTYYPDVFCVALLNSQPMGFYAPGQLVRDARDHGVEVRPVDINHSVWDSTLEETDFDPRRIDIRHVSMRSVIRTGKAVRLGFRQVTGLREAEMEECGKRRGQGYRSMRDLWLRSGLSRGAIEKLADADAFRSLGLDRRQALWQVRALDEKGAAEFLPLFERGDSEDLQKEEAVILPGLSPGEEVIEDYRAVTFSLKAHPLNFLRKELAAQGVTRNRDLRAAPRDSQVTIAGLVLVRQRPGSSKGVIFMTLEDETGVANAIVWKRVFEAYRPVVMNARLVRIRGRLQRENEVIHVVAEHLEDMTHLLGLLNKEKQRFAAMPRVDEVLRPTVDHRERKGMREAHNQTAIEDATRLMPKGRNFH